MSQQTLVLNQEQIKKIFETYDKYLETPPQYATFKVRYKGTVITAYQSGKVVFQGSNALNLATYWQESFGLLDNISKESNNERLKKKINEPSINYNLHNVIGSDEVGTGSYFGPLTVCAVYVAKDKIPLLTTLGVQDSKNLSDKQIRQLAWQIKASVPHKITVCPPIKYNEANQTRNANAIKVALHNFTLLKLWQQLNASEKAALEITLIDQFASPSNYEKYLKLETSAKYPNPLHFQVKAESVSLAVAAASILARDAFLHGLETLGKPYNLILPSGAGSDIDVIGKKLVKQFGPQILYQTAKYHFANTKKILGQN